MSVLKSRHVCVLKSRHVCVLKGRHVCVLKSRHVCVKESACLCVKCRHVCVLKCRHQTEAPHLSHPRRHLQPEPSYILTRHTPAPRLLPASSSSLRPALCRQLSRVCLTRHIWRFTPGTELRTCVRRNAERIGALSWGRRRNLYE